MDDSRCGFTAITFQIIAAGHRVIIKIEDARFAVIIEGSSGQLIFFNGADQCCGHGMRFSTASRLAIDEIAPPLQPDFARQRFVDQITDTRNLCIERV